MKTKIDYLKGHCTVIDKNGNTRTYQSYCDPISGKLKKKGVGWKRKKLRSERQALRYLRDKIEIELFEQPLSDSIVIETFGELIDVWFQYWKPTVRKTTVDTQMKLMKTYLLPFFSRDILLSQLKPVYVESVWSQILNFKGKRSKQPLEKATLEKIRSLFRQITYYGYRNEFVLVDLQKAEMKIPKDRSIKSIARRKKKFLDSSEVTMLLSAIKEKYDKNKKVNKMGYLYLDLVEFMIRNGLRISEIGALTVDKVDFNKKQIIVDEGLVTSGRAVKDYQLNATKTISSTREINLDERSIEIILNRIEINKQRKVEMGHRNNGDMVRTYFRTDNGKPYEQKIPMSKKYQETDIIFQTQNGTPVVYHSFNEFMNGHGNNPKPVKCVLDILHEKYPCFDKHVTTHTFRYTHISLLAESGVQIKAIMERVGHSDVKTTLQIYNQVTKLSEEKLVQEISSWDFTNQE